jgi:NADH:ubiquinone oxidoreductase subunit 2 (chain N)
MPFHNLYQLAYALLPAFTIFLFSIIAAIVGLFKKYLIAKTISYASIVISLSLIIYLISLNKTFFLYNGEIIVDRFSLIIWLSLIIGTAIALGSMELDLISKEALPLTLISLSLAMVAIVARDLLILFLAVEGSILPTYALVAQFKKDPFSLEATVKYFIFGILATLLFVYGIAIIFGTIGSTNFAIIASKIKSSNLFLSVLGFILILLSLAIKSTLVPLHTWAVDTYQGAPTSVTVFISTTSKMLGIAVIALLVAGPFNSMYSITTIYYVLVTFAILTLIVPNVIALTQKDTKRLLAYSSIAHAGYMSLVYVFPNQTIFILGYYLITYSIAKAASFLVVRIITGESSNSPYDALRGLFKQNSLVGLTFALSLLSLAGIPPFAGFMAKFLLFLSTALSSLLGIVLALIALIMSGVSVYYYIVVLRIASLKPLGNGNKSLNSSFEKDFFLVLVIMLLLILTFFPTYFYIPLPTVSYSSYT